MLQAQRSQSKRNQALAELPRTSVDEGNVAWVARTRGETEAAHVLLLGGSDTWSQRLRIAQSHLRHDLSLSHWSHVALLGPTHLYEIPLFPRRNYDLAPIDNGVTKSKLSDYDDPAAYPNVGIFTLPLAWRDVQRLAESFKAQRTSIDALELQLAWLAFAYGVGRTLNPLYDRLGFASAALLEFVTASLGYDLTPAFPSASSCPEAIWQAAIYWYDAARATPDTAPTASISGAYVTERHEVVRARRSAKAR